MRSRRNGGSAWEDAAEFKPKNNMNNSVYKINKGINKPIEFKGLKAQYIGYLGIGVILLLIIFAALYILGVNMFVCLALIVVLGTGLFMGIYHLSETFGQHGLVKKLARRNLPVSITSRSRRMFRNLKHPRV
jgi:hypothetical protein